MRIFKPNRETSQDIYVCLGLTSRGQPLHRAVRNGLDTDILLSLAELMESNTREVAGWLGISRTTLYRRLRSGRLSCAESDKIIGMIRMLEAATRLFDGDCEEAIRWMRIPVSGLGDKCPVQYLRTNVESQAVIDLIERLDHGVFS